jgi:hypothetical protein
LLEALGPLGAIILVIVAKYRQRITGDSAALFIAGSSTDISKYAKPGILPYADSMGIAFTRRIDQTHRGV